MSVITVSKIENYFGNFSKKRLKREGYEPVGLEANFNFPIDSNRFVVDIYSTTSKHEYYYKIDLKTFISKIKNSNPDLDFDSFNVIWKKKSYESFYLSMQPLRRIR